MPNIATAPRDEIRRLARQEIKAVIGATKQAVTQHRRDIAMLKRLVGLQQKESCRQVGDRLKAARRTTAVFLPTIQTPRLAPQSTNAGRTALT